MNTLVGKLFKQKLVNFKAAWYGDGLGAPCDLRAGTLIIAEEPLCTGTILEQTESGESPTEEFEAGKDKAVPLTLATHGPRRNEFGIFKIISRFNHACKPNAQQRWDEHSGRELVYAIRPIVQGEEITISYCPQECVEDTVYLDKVYGFFCCCDWCLMANNYSRPPPETKDSHRRDSKFPNRDSPLPRQVRLQRLAQLPRLFSRIRDTYSSAIYRMKNAYALHQLLLAEKIVDYRLGELLHYAFLAAVDSGDYKRARCLALLAHRAYLPCEGIDSPGLKAVIDRFGEFQRSEMIPFTKLEEERFWQDALPWSGIWPVEAKGRAVEGMNWEWLFMKKEWEDKSEYYDSETENIVDGLGRVVI